MLNSGNHLSLLATKHLRGMDGRWSLFGAGTLLLIAVVVLVQHNAFSIYVVSGWSMFPALSPGDVIITRRVASTHPVRRGDIVVVSHHKSSNRVVKRVIGLPQETVLMSAGELSINGSVIPEPYVSIANHQSSWLSSVLTKDQLFVAGDNRLGSTDSRQLGGISQSELLGGVVVIIPTHKLGIGTN
jgi:signal peptidase I